MPAAVVVPLVDIGGERRKSRIGGGPHLAGVAPIANLGLVAFTARRAGDAQHGRFSSVSVRERAGTALIDGASGGEALHTQVSGERVRRLARDEVRRRQAPGRDRLEAAVAPAAIHDRSEEHTSELQSQSNLVCRLLLEKKNSQRTCNAYPRCTPATHAASPH